MTSNDVRDPGGDIRIAVLDDYQDAALRMADWTPLTGRGAKVTVFRDHIDDSDALVERLRPFQVVCMMRERTRLAARELDRLPNLKMIATTGGRNAALDLHHAQARGIVVSGTGATLNGTPELVWALLLALARNIPGQVQALREGKWQIDVGVDLEGKTLGILGLGIIGSRVARVGAAFGMRVAAWSPHMTAERAAEHGAVHLDKDDFFRQCDFIVVTMQLRASTAGLVGAREIGLMKPSAFLINTSRGELVDEAALIDALRQGRIAGAGVDAHRIEPLPVDHPFRTMDRVIATPHIGFVIESGYRRFFGDTVENIQAWLDGRPLRLVTEQVFNA